MCSIDWNSKPIKIVISFGNSCSLQWRRFQVSKSWQSSRRVYDDTTRPKARMYVKTVVCIIYLCCLDFYSASIILHNINNNISYKVIPLCRNTFNICNSSGSNYINSMLNLMHFSYEKLVHFFNGLILILCILKKMNITLSDRFHLLVLASMYRPNYWYCTGTA